MSVAGELRVFVTMGSSPLKPPFHHPRFYSFPPHVICAHSAVKSLLLVLPQCLLPVFEKSKYKRNKSVKYTGFAKNVLFVF